MTETNAQATTHRTCFAPLPATRPRRFTLPAGSWDTHAHVISLDPAYPMVGTRHYNPHAASAADFIGMLDAVGHRYGVLVQVSVHGTDNRLLLESLRAYPERLRGVAVISPNTPDRELAELKAAGVVGARIQTVVGGGIGPEDFDAITGRCADFGWHLQLCLNGDEYPAMVPRLLKLKIPFVIDHMGWFDIAQGINGAGFQAVMHLVRNTDCLVKILGAFRRSLEGPPYRDTIPYAAALIDAAPDRMVWASDWPHVGMFDAARMPRIGDLLDHLHETTGDPALLKKILVDTPARFYGLPKG